MFLFLVYIITYKVTFIMCLFNQSSPFKLWQNTNMSFRWVGEMIISKERSCRKFTLLKKLRIHSFARLVIAPRVIISLCFGIWDICSKLFWDIEKFIQGYGIFGVIYYGIWDIGGPSIQASKVRRWKKKSLTIFTGEIGSDKGDPMEAKESNTITEPAREIMALFVLRKLILQTHMRSHPGG